MEKLTNKDYILLNKYRKKNIYIESIVNAGPTFDLTITEVNGDIVTLHLHHGWIYKEYSTAIRKGIFEAKKIINGKIRK